MAVSFDDFMVSYSGRIRRLAVISALLAAVLVLTFVVSLAVSQYSMSFSEAYSMLWEHLRGERYLREDDYDMWFKDYVVWNQNLPRYISGVLIGAALATGGAVMQSTMKNPLADPYTTGISSGALFGVSLYIVLGISLPIDADSDLAMIVSAFVFSLIPVALIAFTTVVRKRIVSPTSMILVGIGTMYLFSSASSLLRFIAEPNVAQEVFEWSLGSVGKVGWDEMPFVLAATVVMLIFSLIYSRSLDIVSEGDEVSRSLGVDPKYIRLVSLVVVALCTATVVCFAGTIGFVGLVCPHIGRMLVSTSSRYLIPATALIGAVMLTVSDCLAKVITPTGLPVGVITALIGSPIFVYILVKQRKQTW